MRVLFVSDTHLGFDLPARPRVERRRRGPDFFACFERALEPALRGEVDVVVHGGDLLYRSRVPASLVDARAGAADAGRRRGVPVAARARQPRARARSLPALRGSTSACTSSAGRRTVVIERRGLRVAFAGSPTRAACGRRSRRCSTATRLPRAEADARVLCIHQCVEGATCGPPPGFTFRDGDDVVRRDLPGDVAVVLCGHVHRHQVLRRDLRGRPSRAGRLRGLGRAHVLRGADEAKGFVMATMGRGGPGGRLVACEFRPLPARPMRVHEVADGSPASGLEQELRAAIAALPPDVVLQVRVPEALAGAAALRAASLRALGPPTANITVSVRHPRRGAVPHAPRGASGAGGPCPTAPRGRAANTEIGVCPVQYPHPGLDLGRELAGGPAGAAGVDAQAARRVRPGERGPGRRRDHP